MKYQVVVTDRAARDLEEAYSWYAQRVPDSASRWYNGFLDTLNSLALNPQRCSSAAESKKCGVEVRQLLYGGHRTYRAIFLVREQTVAVLHVRYTARRDAGPADLW